MKPSRSESHAEVHRQSSLVESMNLPLQIISWEKKGTVLGQLILRPISFLEYSKGSPNHRTNPVGVVLIGVTHFRLDRLPCLPLLVPPQY